MRTFEAPPSSVVDPLTGTVRAGSFRGGVPPKVDLSALAARGRSSVGGALFRFAHEKRWIYTLIAADDLLVGAAIVRFGYAANAFVFAYDPGSRRLLAEASFLGPPFFATVGDAPREGASARFSSPLPRGFFSWERASGGDAYGLVIRAGEVSVDAKLSVAVAPPPIGAIAPLGAPGLVNVTEKGALLAVTGVASIKGRRISLDGELGGYDYTYGYLARRTAWNWAFLLGRAESGERVAMNLVEGFVGERECALWVDGALHPLAEGRFEFDRARPGDPWRVRSVDGSVDLRFEPGGVHEEHLNFGVIASRFVQPIGAFSGTIHLAGRSPIVLAGALGVVEDQDVLW